MSGHVEALCLSERKGERKSPVGQAVFRVDHGIEGDAHAGNWHRQVSLLDGNDIDEVRRKLPDIGPGAFAENVILRGLDLASLGLGSRLRLGGEVVMAITQIGKVCHTRCRIYQLTGDCIMPRRGLFAQVEQGGVISVNDPAEILQAIPRERFQAVVLTLSDRCHQGKTMDTAGPAVAGLLEQSLRAHILCAEILPDEQEILADRLRSYSDGRGIDLIVTVGGTGWSPRDLTPEATASVVQRPTPGLDEAMRWASFQKTPRAALSRGNSGIRGSTLILNLPGSLHAATENLQAILEPLDHGLRKLRGDPSDCGGPREAL